MITNKTFGCLSAGAVAKRLPSRSVRNAVSIKARCSRPISPTDHLCDDLLSSKAREATRAPAVIISLMGLACRHGSARELVVQIGTIRRVHSAATPTAASWQRSTRCDMLHQAKTSESPKMARPGHAALALATEPARKVAFPR